MMRYSKVQNFFGLIRNPSLYFSSPIGNKLQMDPNVQTSLKQTDHIGDRFIGPRQHEIKEMLKITGARDLEHLVELIIPEQIYDKNALNYGDFPQGVSESSMMDHLKQLSEMNILNDNYIGQGYYGTLLPAVIQRNIFENPAWYTAYTPYQAEISQGRLESLINYQTMICELTGMDVSNASLLDEATSAAEALFLAYTHNGQTKKVFFADENLFPQSIELLKTKAKYLGIKLIISDVRNFNFDGINSDLCGVMVQTPDNNGLVSDFTDQFNKMPKHIIKIINTDLLALTIIKTPREQGAHITVGNTQRFGVPLGYGGPHAGFFASLDEFKRKLPGRLIGLSKDSHDQPAYRMSLQTREQHIRREKATSNICTAQALLANMAAMYAVYHGPQGLLQIASRVNQFAQKLSFASQELGYNVLNSKDEIFDTVALRINNASDLKNYLMKQDINVRQVNKRTISISFDETHTLQQLQELITHLSNYKNKKMEFDNLFKNNNSSNNKDGQIKQSLQRLNKQYLKQQIFNSLHSEHQMTRYMQYLVSKDISLIHSMISLGSCTMKLNPTSFMIPVTYPGFSKLHPYSPRECTKGYDLMVENMTSWLCNLTGFAGMSFQPNSGAQGEYAGLLCIRQYHIHQGNVDRDVCLIPTSAHGTNPASATLAGLRVVTIGTKQGVIDIDDLNQKVLKYQNNLACIMLTYPSTHGVYEAGVKDVIGLVHQHGGLVYMDGANMNAQCGLTSPGFLGADVCHLNLHKTFSIPHGGGGPGMGPIGVVEKLVPYLPTSYDERQVQSVGQLAGSRYGSASILPISYSYLGQLGKEGVRRSSIIAMLNANYMMKQLEGDYTILYQGQNNMCAHEFILDLRNIKQATGIQDEDIAKRLIDYGFHAPTMSFPVSGTLMIEPTESEDKAELDRFIDAMKSIRNEIRKIENGVYDKLDNPIRNAPHTQQEVCSDEWNHRYTRREAAFPLSYIIKRGKFWPSVGRIQNAYGDRNLVVVSQNQSDYIS